MPERVGPRDLKILIATGAATAALTLASVVLAPADSPSRSDGSSYSTDPAGTRAAYLLLQQLGHDVARSFEPVASLALEPKSTVLVLANPSEHPSNQDRRALQALVESGGVVLAFGPSARTFLPGVGGEAVARPPDQLEMFAAVLPGALTNGAAQVSTRKVAAPTLDVGWIPVFGRDDGVAVVMRRLGGGRIVWSLDHALIQNDGIARADNVTLIANAAGVPGARTIVWDEHYHGERRSFWSYVAATPLVWGGAQLGLIAVVLLLSVSRRRGPLRSRTVESRTSSLEFIDTMAALYERAGATRAAIESARLRLRRSLASATGLSPSTGDADLAAAAASRSGLDGQRIAAALSDAADALRRGLSDEAVPVVAELQALSTSAANARAGRAR